VSAPRVVSDAATAARRLAEAYGFGLHSTGRAWNLSYGETVWASPLSAVEVMGTILDIVRFQPGRVSYADSWLVCRYVPRKDTDGGWQFPDMDTQAGCSVVRMLRDAESAGHLEGLQ
jgi:hypothetical protein